MERGFRGGSNLVSRAGSFLVSAEVLRLGMTKRPDFIALHAPGRSAPEVLAMVGHTSPSEIR